jgi:probable RNA-binding protein EIF1AD
MGKSRRAIVAEAEEALEPPQTLTDSQSVVRVIKPEGNNVYTCQLPNNSRVQLELAQHFRNTVYMRRGGFVLAERYPADSEEKRVDGEIVNIVRDEKLWRKLPYWYVQCPSDEGASPVC